MIYMGSKRRIAPHILPIILEGRKEGQYYVEPFCGGCNSLEHVTGPRMAGDYNRYLIAMWQGFQQGREYPITVTREMFNKAKADFKAGTNEHYDDALIGWIGGVGSFRGAYFNGYGDTAECTEIIRRVRNIHKQLPKLMDVEFHYCSYDELPIPDKSIIYCDIPYKDTAQYNVCRGFDHDKFWSWCADQKKRGIPYS